MKGKFTKRFLAMLMAATMVFSMGIVASAAEKSDTDVKTDTDGDKDITDPDIDPDLSKGVKLPSGNVLAVNGENVTLFPVAGALTEDDYLAAIDAAVAEGASTIVAVITLENMSTISATVVGELKDNGLGINILVVKSFSVDENELAHLGASAYAWMIPEVTNAVALNPALAVNPENSEAAKLVDGKSLVVDFAQNGAIPGLAQIGVATTAEDVNGINNPVLYYYNPESKVLEKQDNEVQVGDGETDFMLEHCSTYVIADKDAKAVTNVNASNPQTGDSAPIALFAVAMVIALGAAAVVVIRKRRVA